MRVNEGDVVIVVKADGQVWYWAQDTPEVLEVLEHVEELSTCACEEDHCPAEEMPGWRQQLIDGLY